MRLSGTLVAWNDDRGFGFIAPTNGHVEVFVHISALPKDGSRPSLGEKVTYELGRGNNGKPQATNVERRAVGQHIERTGPPLPRPKQRNSTFFKLVALLLFVAIGTYGVNQYRNRASVYAGDIEPATTDSTPSTTEPARRSDSKQSRPPPTWQSDGKRHTTRADEQSGFKCDGRTRCSQMTSCAEATLFLKYCPDTQMDGDHDGIPCEQQWCTN